jgi:hypothetical protein
VLPPFGLVDFAERAGLASINPEALPVADLIALLVDDIPPARLAPASVTEVLQDTASWHMRYPFAQGWFEDDHAVGALLGGKRSTAQRRTTLILEQYLPTRRARWAEILGWAALIMKHDRTSAELWVDFALVARELLSERPLSEIPLMVTIAAITVEAWKAGPA